MPVFSIKYQDILALIEAFDPVAYAKSRNYSDGAVSRLSPYISRGVISTRLVYERLLKRGIKFYQMEKFVQELAWRDFWQRQWQHHGVGINQDLKRPQEHVRFYGLPRAIQEADTGIDVIDKAIEELYQTGYMHNHLRMYLASIVCNVGQYHWRIPAQWMFAHLLDGDWASNALSWQWVAGTFSNRKYVANQENINKYFNSAQRNTFLDVPYEAFNNLEVPAELLQSKNSITEINYPESISRLDLEEKKTLVYNYYNLDPLWYEGEDVQRVLLIEPAVFERYPISQKCMDFAVGLSANIKDIKIFVGSFTSLQAQLKDSEIVFKEHPLNTHYHGVQEDRDWMTSVKGYFPGFFKFWNKAKKELVK